MKILSINDEAKRRRMGSLLAASSRALSDRVEICPVFQRLPLILKRGFRVVQKEIDRIDKKGLVLRSLDFGELSGTPVARLVRNMMIGFVEYDYDARRMLKEAA